MDAPKKNSRWTREPSLKKGKPRSVRITPRDIEVLKLLHRYRYLQSDDICAFVGGSAQQARKRLNFLSRKPLTYINRPHQQRENANANYAPLVYELDSAGSTVLRELGFSIRPKVYHRNFVHELMVNRIMASLDLGIRASKSASLITWAEILAADHTPKKLKEVDAPTHIPYQQKVKGGSESATIAADGLPFGIQQDGKYYFFPGIEADCGTEPITTGDADRSSIVKKLTAYRYIMESKTYETHFGFPNLFVPFLFPTIARMESAMALWDRMTVDAPALRRFVLFKTFPTLTSFGKQAPATGHVFTEPFRRVGLAPYSLVQLK
ncbi:MAG: replication-relaxation family protein [Planctomycetota bacterium]